MTYKTQWRGLFKHIPVESMVYTHQQAYYQALNKSTLQTDSAPFIEFMLTMILEICTANIKQNTPQATPQVMQLIKGITGEMNRDDLLRMLGLKDRKSFRKRYLLPALSAGFIAMTIPDKPRSSLQKYYLTQKGRKLRGH